MIACACYKSGRRLRFMATTFERHVLENLEGWRTRPADLLVGTWKLVSCDAYRRNGQIVALYGRNPDGRLFYDASGNMSVNVMRRGRPAFGSAQKSRASGEEMRAAYQGYEAYFATYSVDEPGSLILHRVLGGLFPNWTGTLQARYFRFDGPDR